jgi:hypothetical protein
MAGELSDAEVFGASRELSDEQVFGGRALANEAARATPPGTPLSTILASPDATSADVPYTDPAGQGALGRIGEAALKGAREGPLVTPYGLQTLEAGGPAGRYIYSPLLQAANPWVGALAGGLGQAAYEAGNVVGGPRLGRDLYAINQLMPAVSGMPGIITPSGGPVSAGTIIRNTLAPWEDTRMPLTLERSGPRITRSDNVDSFLSRQTPEVVAEMAKTNPDAAAWLAERQGAAERQALAEGAGTTAEGPAAGTAGPQSVGAAASREGTPAFELELTPKEIEAYRATAEGSKLIEPQQPSFADHKEYIPGVTISEPEAMQTAEAARTFKDLKAKDPELADKEQVAADANNTKYTNHFDNLAGSPRTLQLAEQARDEPAAAAREQLWANQKPTDPTPVVDAANQILAGGEGRRSGIRNAVNAATKELYDADGNLVTEPRILYGVRQHITDMLEAKDITGQKVNAVAIGQLTRLKQVLDGVIENGAPGFGDYLRNFAEASRKIDEMRALQGYRTSLFDSHGIMQPARVQKMMKDIVDARAARSLEPEQSFTPETMQDLWNLRDSLRRKAAAERLAKAPGSDTAQNFFDAMREHAEGKAGAVAAGTIGTILGAGHPVAGLAGIGVQQWLSHAAQARRYKQGMEMLYPNRLMTPPASPPPAP